MSETCTCGHGQSWHSKKYFPSEFPYGGYYKHLSGCSHQDCSCQQFERLYYNVAELEEKTVMWSPEQVAALEKLKAEREQSIQIPKDFHELFCKVLKEKTDRQCDCEGTTSEIRI